jgi:hypothetical protein
LEGVHALQGEAVPRQLVCGADRLIKTRRVSPLILRALVFRARTLMSVRFGNSVGYAANKRSTPAGGPDRPSGIRLGGGNEHVAIDEPRILCRLLSR